MAKRFDERAGNVLQTGRHSANVDKILKSINIDPLSEVNKMKFKTMSEQIIARSNAFNLDSYARQLISDHIKEAGLQVTTYQSDLDDTQGKLAKQEFDLGFHRKVLDDLQSEYLTSEDDNRKRELLERIAIEEDILNRGLKLYNDLINTRNKIRTCLDRNIKNRVRYTQMISKGDDSFSIEDIDDGED